jgi:DNA-binding winged helix-turn-helix (wHTH) protein
MQDFPPFRLDPSNQCLWRRREPAPDERILLPPKAFAVLRYLVAHAGQLVTQDELLEAVWPETHVQPEVLKSRIFEVRSALGDRPGDVSEVLVCYSLRVYKTQSNPQANRVRA